MIYRIPILDSLEDYYFEDNLISVNNTTNYINKLNTNFTSTWLTKCLINWYAEVAQANAGQRTDVRIIDNLTNNIITETSIDFNISNQYKPISGFKQLQFTDGIINLSMQFKTTSANRMAYIKNTRLYFKRSI